MYVHCVEKEKGYQSRSIKKYWLVEKLQCFVMLYVLCYMCCVCELYNYMTPLISPLK